MSDYDYESMSATRRTVPMLYLYSAVLFLLMSAPALSANIAGYTLDYVGRDYGLPQSSVRAIAQDPSGFLWVGTESGMYRYDGSQFDLFEPPFGHGVANTIAIDTRGRVWTSWFNKPTTIYNPSTRRWATLDVRPPRTLPLGFLEDPSGRIWLSDGSVLYTYDENSGEATTVLELEYEAGSVVTQDLVWDDGTIWLSDANGILGYDTDNNVVLETLLRNIQPAIAILVSEGIVWLCHKHRVYKKARGGRFEIHYENRDIEVASCTLDATGHVWLGTLDAGAFEVISTEDVRHHRHDASNPQSIGSNQVGQIFLDESGRLWLVSASTVSLYDNGLFSVNSYNSAGSGVGFATSPDLQIIQDRSGVIWLGTASDGLARLSRYSRKFRSAIPPASDTRTRKPVMDNFGNLWIGMKQGGVYRWNRTHDTWSHYSADIDIGSSLPTTEVRALLSTTTGELYAGSEIGILARFNGDIDGWDRIDIGGTEPIYNLLELPDHRIVIGRHRKLSVYDPTTSTTSHFQLSRNGHARATATSKNGRVWVGTIEGPGLVEFDPARGLLRSWPDLFRNMKVISLYEDNLGIVWVGTWGDGLIRFNPESGHTQRISIENGLSDHTIAGILPGAQNDLWISGEKGLTRIQSCISTADVCKPKLTTYDVSDGLSNRWFSADSYSVSSSGELFVGGSSGVDFFHPSFFEENRVPPRVGLVEVSLNGEVMPGETNRSNRFRLPHEFGELAIRFAATDFHDPEKNQYRYRMNGGDPWVSLDNSGRMSLRNLQSGTHELEISGSNNDGVWSSEPILITIGVAKPAYSSWWAIALYCILAAVLLFTASRYRERRNQEYMSELEQKVEQRTVDLHKANHAMAEFYANVSHEVRTPLSVIVSAVDQLHDASESRSTERVLTSIRRHTQSLIRYVDGLITVSQLKSSTEPRWRAEDAIAFLRQMIEDFKPLAGTRRVIFEKPVDATILVRTQPNAMTTIFSNIFVNAIKHADDDGTIRLSVDTDHAFAHFSIEDDGPGVESEIREKVFDRGALYSTTSGYGIGLHLVRQTAIAIGGNVTVGESNLGGACFRVSIPLADQSLSVIESLTVHAPDEIDSDGIGASSNYTTSSITRPTILIVEDHDELRRNICQYLASKYNVLESATAGGSFTIAAEEVPDVVLCDVMLPDGSGFDVVKQIKNSPITDHIPVVLLTALADENSRMQGLENRADAYLTKPIQRTVLETTLDNLIRDRRNVLRHAALRVWNENREEGSGRHDTRQEFANRFISLLELCYSNPTNNVETLAKKLAMSRRALERKTRQYFDRSPNELLTEFRLQKATRLLREGSRIVDLSLACGFGGQSHFGAVFRKRFGCTPRDYAMNHSKEDRIKLRSK